MSNAPHITTAAALLSYRKELIEGGILEENADILVRDAAAHLVADNGLGVRA
jgi:hypothetical protein